MSTPTMDTEQRQDMPCRLCLENITPNEIQSGMDILTSNDVRKLLQEVYEVQVLPDDSSSTMLCLPCYQQLVLDYNFRMKLFTLRKTFKLNQTMLVAQIIEFRGTSEEHSNTKSNGDRFVSVRVKSTQTMTPERCSPTTTNPLENGSVESDVVEPQSIAETATKAKTKLQLVPLIVDCLKDPNYVKALYPLVVSTDPDNPAPLVFICDCCYKKFLSKETLELHRTMSCVPTCRFCLSEQTADHSCSGQSKYAEFMQNIVGSQKYVTTYATGNAISEHIADESVADVEEDGSNEPKKKKAKLDANHNGRDSSSERRSGTPFPWKKSHTAPEIRSELETTSTYEDTLTVVTIISSTDEEVVKIDPIPDGKNRSKKKHRRR